MHPQLARFFILACLLGYCCSCGHSRPRTAPPGITCSISGFADSQYPIGKTFNLVNASGSQEDLEFREYKAIVIRAMAERGFQHVDVVSEADVAVFLEFGISEPIPHQYTTSYPLFQYIAGQTLTSVATASAYTPNSGVAVAAGTQVITPSRVQYAGEHTETHEFNSFRRHLRLEAIRVKEYLVDKKVIPVWKTDVLSEGTIGDLREIFPLMMSASIDHIGNDTGTSIQETSPRGNAHALYLKTGTYGPNGAWKLEGHGYHQAVVAYSNGEVPPELLMAVNEVLHVHGMKQVANATGSDDATLLINIVYDPGLKSHVSVSFADAKTPSESLCHGEESESTVFTSVHPATIFHTAWNRAYEQHARMVGYPIDEH